MKRLSAKLAPVILLAFLMTQEGYRSESKLKQGLIGLIFSKDGFRDPNGLEPLKSLDASWTGSEMGYSDWSAIWRGLLTAPTSGDVDFKLRSTWDASLKIGNAAAVQAGENQKEGHVSIGMKQGERYPIEVTFSKKTPWERDDALKVEWRWGEDPFAPVPVSHLRYSEDQMEEFKVDFPSILEPPGRKPDVIIDGKNVIVYYEPGRFAAWPANGGLWAWENEILVNFGSGYFEERWTTHSIDKSKPGKRRFARSLDGGETWKPAEAKGIAWGKDPIVPPSGVDFTHAGFGMFVKDGVYRVTYDRGNTWEGPYELVDMDRKLTSRTDYIVNGPSDCHFFLSTKFEKVQAGLQDRAFCARTEDGGKTIEFVSWITGKPIEVRSVMPSTVRVSETELVSALRRRVDRVGDDGIERAANWIDVYASEDNGRTWEFRSQVAETDTGKHNGNPPAMVRLQDGRLCVAYGYRAKPYGIRAKISSDDGRTWGPELAIRNDASKWDIGYPKMVVRPDGKLVTVYYITTEDRPENHIEATIWDPSEIRG